MNYPARSLGTYCKDQGERYRNWYEPGLLSKIFEAFTRERNTTKSKYTGSGLGMSIVKKYVDLLGGTIESRVSSERATLLL